MEPALLHYQPKASPPAPGLDRAKNIKILVVDDDVEAVVPMHLTLAGFGCEITIAFSGQSAIDHLLKKNFDLVILDWHMPDLDGKEVLKQAQGFIAADKNRAHGKTQIPFVTYSGSAFKDIEIPDCANFDFVGHWHKPISLNKLSFLTSEIMSWLKTR